MALCVRFLFGMWGHRTIEENNFSPLMIFIVPFARSQYERESSFQTQASLSSFLLSYLWHIINKFLCDVFQLSPLLCQRTAWSLIDLFSFPSMFLCLPTPMKRKVVQYLCKNNFTKIYLILSTQEKHLLKRWSMRVCLFIGNPLASLNLVT